MDFNTFIGGGEGGIPPKSASLVLKIAPIAIATLFVIIALGTLPGTIGHKQKYVEKDNVEKELKLSKMAIPVSLLSFTLLILIGAMVLVFMDRPKAATV